MNSSISDSRSRSQLFDTAQDFKIVNTQLKFEGKIHYGSKLLHSQGITQIFLSFKANLTLKIKVKVTSFQTHPTSLDDH